MSMDRKGFVRALAAGAVGAIVAAKAAAAVEVKGEKPHDIGPYPPSSLPTSNVGPPRVSPSSLWDIELLRDDIEGISAVASAAEGKRPPRVFHIPDGFDIPWNEIRGGDTVYIAGSPL